MRRVLGLLVVLALAAGGWWAYRHYGPRRVQAVVKVPTAVVERGHLTVALPVNGVLGSAEETPVRGEVDGKILQICENSIPVKKGDLLVTVDPKKRQDDLDKVRKELSDALEAANKAAADGQVRIDQADSGVTKAQDALDLAKEKAAAQQAKLGAQVSFAEGELARSGRELERDQRLAELHYIPGTRLQSTEKAYRQQQFNVEKQKLAKGDGDKQAAEDIAAAEMALRLAQKEQGSAKAAVALEAEDGKRKIADIKTRIKDLEEQLTKCKITAPVDGLAVIGSNVFNWPQRRPWQVGDDLRPGFPVVTIYNVDLMQVRCQVGEMDISRIKKGQLAYVLSPAQTGRRYKGEVTAVEELGHDADIWSGGTPGKKTFGALVAVDEPDPKQLRPGMTVDLEIVLQKPENVLTVPIRAVLRQGKKAIVYRARGRQFEAVPVTVGVRSDLQVAVRGQLTRGDRVALVEPPAGRLVAAGAGQ